MTLSNKQTNAENILILTLIFTYDEPGVDVMVAVYRSPSISLLSFTFSFHIVFPQKWRQNDRRKFPIDDVLCVNMDECRCVSVYVNVIHANKLHTFIWTVSNVEKKNLKQKVNTIHRELRAQILISFVRRTLFYHCIEYQ